MISQLSSIRKRKNGRASSWDQTGRNLDWWYFNPGESRVLADIEGPGRITHIWMTQPSGLRDVLIRCTWDNAARPSVVVPLGDFFGLGHTIANTYQCLLFGTSTDFNNHMNGNVALNSYVQMPFRERAVIELVNESNEEHFQYFYIDYETLDEPLPESEGYFHAEFRRANPFPGWGHEIPVNVPEQDVVNAERIAWNNNYVILDTKGCGQYIGCNLSVTNFQGTWWGEGDDMIWVDGYKWPPDLHGTGSEDYLCHAWGMQRFAGLRCGTSIHEGDTSGYQTSYVHHIENPIYFNNEIKVTIESGHANHLANEISSVAYWYADQPCAAADPPPVKQRQPVLRDAKGFWRPKKENQTKGKAVKMTKEMREMKAAYNRNQTAVHGKLKKIRQKDWDKSPHKGTSTSGSKTRKKK